jgi:hypothetical protein
MKTHRAFRLAGAGILAGVMLMSIATPLYAEIDLSGRWATRNHEDYVDKTAGPPLVQYWGLPINDAARNRALSYTVGVLSVPERQCLYYGPQYRVSGPSNMAIWSESDAITGKVTAWHISGFFDLPPMVIYMDGRPHPGPMALHTFGGFATGKWVGDVLVVDIDHVKESFLRRNGVPLSDQAQVTWFLARHGDLLSFSEIVTDPVYLSEPYALSKIFKEMPTMQMSIASPPCVPVDELPELSNHKIPQNEPGENPNLNDMRERYGVPTAAALGGAQTMYPEYRATLIQDGYKTPLKYCSAYCCGWGVASPVALKLLKCDIE